MAGVLEEAGYSCATDVSEANVVIYNTCSIRDKAEQKVYSALGKQASPRRIPADPRRSSAAFLESPQPEHHVAPQAVRNMLVQHPTSRQSDAAWRPLYRLCSRRPTQAWSFVCHCAWEVIFLGEQRKREPSLTCGTPAAQAKRKRQHMGSLKLVVAGCVAAQEGAALLRRVPELDLVMGPHHANRYHPPRLHRDTSWHPCVNRHDRCTNVEQHGATSFGL